MNRNAKIALGCGGGGCLVLILIVVVFGVLVVSGVIKAPGLYSSNSNSNYNYNSNSNRDSNLNSNTNLNSNSNTSSSSSTLSDDDKHKLLQAAGRANDSELLQKALRKMGFISDTGVSDDYAQFIKDHAAWGVRNREFVRSVDTPEAARAYVNEHIDD
jgi:alpha-galactosidase